MSPNIVSLWVFASVFVVSLFAMRLRSALPANHLSDETKNTVTLTMGLVATMAALVLGLLVASTKEAYDTESNEVTQMAAKIIYLDRILVGYGTESAETRELLRHTVETAIVRMWPDETKSGSVPDPSASWNELLPVSIQKLSPQNDAQRTAKSEAAQIASDLGQMRWLLFEQSETSISMPLLVVLICWLAILFFSFGLFAPANSTAVIALMVSSLSVAGAIFLILELDHPFEGIIHISSGPLRNVLTHFGN